MRNPLSPALLVAGLLWAAMAPTTAAAQSLSPMRQAVSSSTDQFVIRVRPQNPYGHRIAVTVRVYDQDFRLIRARVVPRVMNIGAGGSRQVTVTVPFEQRNRRKIRICAESTPQQSHSTNVRTRICGRYLAQRVK